MYILIIILSIIHL